MRRVRLVITGRPGVGKSTLFNMILDHLRLHGCRVGGISAPEVRVGGRRIGFRIVDIGRGMSGWLAKVGLPGTIRVGRYTVVERDAVNVGVAAIRWALQMADVVGIDEIGPMELKVRELREAIINALKSDKPIVTVVHFKLPSRDPVVYGLLGGSRRVLLTEDNRDAVQLRAEEYAGWIADAAGCSGAGG